MNKLPQIHKIGDSDTRIKVQAEIANLESFMENKHWRSLENNIMAKQESTCVFYKHSCRFCWKNNYVPSRNRRASVDLLARKIKAYK